MVKFTETHHAFISARYYARLKESGRENFEDIFLFAVRHYGAQRGGRMAQRALRDGRPLNFAAYRYYSEWAFTEEYLSTATAFSRDTERDENYSFEVRDCPWNRVYQEQGLPDGALAYCRDLDCSIVRGFNPELRYAVERFPGTDPLCRQTQFHAELDQDAGYPERDPDNRKDFTYHCGHVFAVFRTTLRNCLGTSGDRITDGVLADFAARFGEEAKEALLAAAATDFSLL